MKDQRGFTLVELLIGIVILSIVTAAVCSFIIVGSKSYAAANTEIMLQQEAQLALNQISDVIIDTTRSVNYAGYTEDGSPVLAVKDADFTFEPQDKSLTMFNGANTIKLDSDGKPIQAVNEDGSLKVDSEGNPVYEMYIESGRSNEKNYQFYWNKEEAKLYYSEIDVDQKVFPQNAADGQVVLAEYVTEFNVDLTQVEEKRVVQISMTFERDNKTYHTSNNITIRNKVRVNDVDLEQLDKRVKLSVIPKENSVILEPGETYHFSTPLVSGQNVMDKSVTWSISAETPPDDSTTQFIDTANGIINIASGETADSFKVIITTNAADSEEKHATAEVIVYVKRAKTVALSLDGGSTEITAGTDFTINASVEGNKLGVSCGGCGDETAIDKYVIADEYPAYGWQVLSGEEFVEIVSCNNKSAGFKISADAQEGDTVVIQAASLLSAKKGYTKDGGSGIVYGTITLTVKGGEKIRLDWNGDLLYGNGPNLYNAGGINSDDPVFLVCVRIKKDPAAPVSDDLVMIYTTEGTNARLKPDTWFLNMNQEYVVSVQLINILSDPALRDANHNKTQAYHDLRNALSSWSGSGNSWQGQRPGGDAYNYLKNYVDNVFWPEYTGNLNPATGAYRGTKYPEYSNLMPGVVKKPRIGIESYLDGKTHYDGVDAKTIYTVQRNSLNIACHIGSVTSTWGSAVYQNQAYYNVYKGSGNYTEWERLYYGPEDYSTPPAQKPSYVGTGNINNILRFDNGELSNYVSCKAVIDFGNSGGHKDNNYNYEKKKQLVGTYHFVPVLPYVNQPEGVYLKVSDNYYNEMYDGKQYCYDFTSTFNFEIKDGGNFEQKVWMYTDDGFQNGEIFFPLPSDPAQFPSEFRNIGAEEVSLNYYNMTYLLDGEGKLHEPKFSEIKCRYAAERNVYELKLYYDYTDIYGITKRCCAGTFICEPDGNAWRMFSGGEYDKQLMNGQKTLVFGSGITMWALTNSNNFMQGEVYFPAPSEKEKFEAYFKLQNTSLQEVNAKSFKMVTGDQNTQDVHFSRITCRYSNNVYEIEFFYQMDAPGWNRRVEYSAGRFQCDANGTKWVRRDDGNLDNQFNSSGQNSVPVNNVQVDGSSAAFTMTDYDGSTKAVKAYIPLPSEEAFTRSLGFKPGQEGEQQWSGKLTMKCQREGITSLNDFDLLNVKCTYNRSTDTYTLEVVCECWYDTGTIGWQKLEENLKLQCKSTDTRWTVVN